jgi:peptidoglycan hydrolase-like protein with peptidoglycan-binding domain
MSDPRHRSALYGTVGLVAAACVVAAVVTSGSGSSSSDVAAAADSAVSVVDSSPVAGSSSDSTVLDGSTSTDSSLVAEGLAVVDGEDLVGADPASIEECTLTSRSLGGGSTGADVICLQEALREAGYLDRNPTGTYDNQTAAAVEKLQTERNLFVDGLVGRETALSLGIWPDEQSLVVRTPPPPPGAVDLLGYPLSSVATSGPDAPPLPENSGSGRRVVYSRDGQRVWAVDENEVVIRSWLVSGSKYNNELPGTHEVYSRSEMSTAWNGKAFLPQMIRWLKTDIGHIGFHAIPLLRSDKSPYQTEAELGQRLSGGCQRQANADAAFMWDFAQVGTKVVVV